MEDEYELGIGIRANTRGATPSIPQTSAEIGIQKAPPPDVPEYDKSVVYDYPMVNKTGLTDYGTDTITLDRIQEVLDGGSKPQETFEKSGNALKYQALMHKRYLSQGMDSEIAAAKVGIPYEAITKQSPIDRYLLGIEEDNLKTAAGATNLVQGLSKYIYDDEDINYADDLSKRSTMATDKFNAVSDLYNHLNTEYTSKGVSSTPWDISGTAGQMTTAGLMGAAIGGAIKGGTALQTAQRQAGAQLGAGLTLEIAQAGQHKDPAQFMVGVASTLAGEALGLWMTKRFYKPDLNRSDAKSVDEITQALDGMNLLKKHNIDLGSEDLLDPNNITAKIEAQITSGKLTEAEANEMLGLYTDRTMGVMHGLKKSLEGMGITDSRQFKDYANGKIALDDMPEQFRNFWDSQNLSTQARLEPKYKELEGLDGAATGNPTQYNVIALNNDLAEATLISKEVGNYVASESKYLRRFEKLEDTELNKEMVGYSSRKKINSRSVLNVNADIDQVEKQLAKLRGENAGRKLALGRSTNSAKRMTVVTNTLKADEQIKQLESQLTLGKLKRGNYLKASRKLDESMAGIKQAHRNLKTKDEMTFMDLVEMRKSLTQKMFNRGGSLSSDSDVQEEALGRAIGTIDKFMAKNVSKEAWVKLGLVNQEAKQAFNLWGGSSATKNMKKVVKNGSKEQLLAMFTGDKAQEALNTLKKIRGADDQMYIDMQAKVLGDRVLKDVEKASGIKDIKKIDFDQLAYNIRNPDTRKLIVDVAGKEAYEGLNGIAYVAEVFGKELETVRQTTSTLLRTNVFKGQDKQLNKNVLSKYGARLSWLAERYSAGLIKGKHFTGSTQMGPVRNALRDSIADAIEIVSGQTNLRVDMLGHVIPKGVSVDVRPNRTYSLNQAIKELKSSLAKADPQEKLTIMDKLLSSLESKLGKSEGGMRPAHLGGNEEQILKDLPRNSIGEQSLKSFTNKLKTPQDIRTQRSRIDAKFDSGMRALNADITDYVKGIEGVNTPMDRLKYVKANKDTDDVLIRLTSRKDRYKQEYLQYDKALTEKAATIVDPRQVLQDTWARGADIEDVYHGTPDEIKAFVSSKHQASVHNVKGTYTTIYPEDAAQYANAPSSKRTSSQANIMPLKARNEKLIDTQNTEVGEEIAKRFNLPDYKLNEIQSRSDSGNYNIGSLLLSSRDKDLNTEILMSLGYTGLRDGPHRVHFNPNDLKSRYSKNFSLGDNDVATSLVGTALGAGLLIDELGRNNE